MRQVSLLNTVGEGEYPFGITCLQVSVLRDREVSIVSVRVGDKAPFTKCFELMHRKSVASCTLTVLIDTKLAARV